MFLLCRFLLLATFVLIPKACTEVAYFVLYLPCLKALINESYVYFLSFHDFHFIWLATEQKKSTKSTISKKYNFNFKVTHNNVAYQQILISKFKGTE